MPPNDAPSIPPPRVALAPTVPDDEPRLNRLLQLYAYDLSESLSLDVGDDALFDAGDRFARAWSGVGTHAFSCRVDDRLAGFVLLDERSWLTGDPGVVDVAQFFIMKKYRLRGVGFACATQAFDLFPQRKWEVREDAKNTAGIAFWRRTIDRYTGGRFDERVLEDERWHGPVQSFGPR
jgi:predicted acetyltransferase